MNWATNILVLILSISLMIPSVAWSAEYEDKALVTFKGQEGYFFSEEVGDKILADLVEFKELKLKKIPALELKIKWMQYDLDLHKRELQYTERIAQKAQENFKESEELRIDETQHLREQLAQRLSWYKSPTTVFIIGIVVGSALVVGLTFGLREMR